MQDTPPVADITLDAGRSGCCDLLLLIVKEMRTLQPHQILHVLAYDPGAAEDIPAWCRTTQNSLIYQTPSQDRLQPSHFYIRKKGMAPIVKATG